jgi:predicted thioesterase
LFYAVELLVARIKGRELLFRGVAVVSGASVLKGLDVQGI